MAATAQLRYSTVARHHSNPSDNRRFSNNPNSSISFPYSKTLNRAISFVPKPIWRGKPELSFSGGNGDGHSGAGAGGNSGGWSRGGGDGNSDDSSSSSSSAVQGFGVLGMFLNGWRSRVAADPQFPFKVLMEEVVGVSSCVLGDMASRPNFGLNELDFVFSTLVVGSILNFTLMYLLAMLHGHSEMLECRSVGHADTPTRLRHAPDTPSTRSTAPTRSRHGSDTVKTRSRHGSDTAGTRLKF